MRYCRFSYDKVVIGGNLNAFLYSYNHGLPLIINKLDSPPFFEVEKKKLWNELYFLLSLAGLNVLGDKTDTIRIDENELTVSTKDFKVVKIKFTELIVFDDSSLFGLPIPQKEENRFIVLDWMVAKSCVPHDKVRISTRSDFVKNIYFYPTDRVDGNHAKIKDLVAVSYLTMEQLQDFNYSDTYVRFKTTKLLKKNGLTGRKNGFHNGKQITYTLGLEVKKRETMRMGMNLYEDTDNLIFKYKDVLPFKSSLSKCVNKLNNTLNVL
jgi:hypothetical protein